MLTADYIAISVLIVLTLWAGAKRFLRGKHLISTLVPSENSIRLDSQHEL
jgi:hypothetical protein